MGSQKSDTTGRLSHTQVVALDPLFHTLFFSLHGPCWTRLPSHSDRPAGPPSQLHSAPPHAHPSDPPGIAPGRAIRARLEEQRLAVASGCDRCPQRLSHSTWSELSAPVQNLCSPDSPRRARLVPSGPERCPLRAHSPAPHSTYPQPKKTVRQAPLSMGISRQEYWSGLPCPPPGDPPHPRIEPASHMSPTLASATWKPCACFS